MIPISDPMGSKRCQRGQFPRFSWEILNQVLRFFWRGVILILILSKFAIFIPDTSPPTKKQKLDQSPPKSILAIQPNQIEVKANVAPQDTTNTNVATENIKSIEVRGQPSIIWGSPEESEKKIQRPFCTEIFQKKSYSKGIPAEKNKSIFDFSSAPQIINGLPLRPKNIICPWFYDQLHSFSCLKII